MNSADGSAAYIENLRTLYLYDEAASEKRGIYPGSQAGEADMFAWSQDQQTWAPNEYWLWDLRGEIAANMSSGNYQLNTPIFDMYINDLPAIEAWTKAQMGGLPGACVPETMSFNGNGYYNDGPALGERVVFPGRLAAVERGGHQQRRGAIALHVGTVPGHR